MKLVNGEESTRVQMLLSVLNSPGSGNTLIAAISTF